MVDNAVKTCICQHKELWKYIGDVGQGCILLFSVVVDQHDCQAIWHSSLKPYQLMNQASIHCETLQWSLTGFYSCLGKKYQILLH